MQYPFAKPLRQALGSQNVDMHAKKAFGFELYGHKRHESSAGCRIDEQVQIAAICIVPVYR